MEPLGDTAISMTASVSRPLSASAWSSPTYPPPSDDTTTMEHVTVATSTSGCALSVLVPSMSAMHLGVSDDTRPVSCTSSATGFSMSVTINSLNAPPPVRTSAAMPVSPMHACTTRSSVSDGSSEKPVSFSRPRIVKMSTMPLSYTTQRSSPALHAMSTTRLSPGRLGMRAICLPAALKMRMSSTPPAPPRMRVNLVGSLSRTMAIAPP
mmetsp:Transcript_1166/g.3734  ORF Transcript_1166/g.3734 Transcript_1166/m.3734 type:complete len:209 (+) Transcript_1166:341-967(+)